MFISWTVSLNHNLVTCCEKNISFFLPLSSQSVICNILFYYSIASSFILRIFSWGFHLPNLLTLLFLPLYSTALICLEFETFLQDGSKEKGVVYPGVTETTVVLDPGETSPISCVNFTDTSCSATVTSRRFHKLTLTQNNCFGSTINKDLFDCKLQYYGIIHGMFCVPYSAASGSRRKVGT